MGEKLVQTHTCCLQRIVPEYFSESIRKGKLSEKVAVKAARIMDRIFVVSGSSPLRKRVTQVIPLLINMNAKPIYLFYKLHLAAS